MSDSPEPREQPAQLLMRDRESLARAVTDALYAESGERLARHGARGHERCLEDMHFNVDHLIPAVDLQDAAMFVRYVEWLHGLLHAREVDTADVARCLELLRDEATRRYDADDARAIGVILEAGLHSLPNR